MHTYRHQTPGHTPTTPLRATIVCIIALIYFVHDGRVRMCDSRMIYVGYVVFPSRTLESSTWGAVIDVITITRAALARQVELCALCVECVYQFSIRTAP